MEVFNYSPLELIAITQIICMVEFHVFGILYFLSRIIRANRWRWNRERGLGSFIEPEDDTPEKVGPEQMQSQSHDHMVNALHSEINGNLYGKARGQAEYHLSDNTNDCNYTQQVIDAVITRFKSYGWSQVEIECSQGTGLLCILKP